MMGKNRVRIEITSGLLRDILDLPETANIVAMRVEDKRPDVLQLKIKSPDAYLINEGDFIPMTLPVYQMDGSGRPRFVVWGNEHMDGDKEES